MGKNTAKSMERNKEYLEFGKYVQSLRMQKQIPLEKLCRGLCSTGHMVRIEDMERQADKLLQDRLLERMGVSTDIFENFLEYEEYVRWKARQDICGAVVHGRWESAGELLAAYEQGCGGENRTERQFCLAVQGMLCHHRGEPEQAGKAFMEALELTVPDAEGQPIEELCLAPCEVILLLECMEYSDMPKKAERYQEIITYLRLQKSIPTSKADVYPRAVLGLCRHCRQLREQGSDLGVPDERRLLELCMDGIELLRDTGRLYYLWELLDETKSLLAEELRLAEYRGRRRDVERLKELQEQTDAWRGMLEKLYDRYGIPREMDNFCYLYIEREVYCIGDVVRVRRQMLGMTQKELCGGICSIRTLSRLEQNQATTQRDIIRQLMDRLGLSSELARTEIVTASHEAKETMHRLHREFDQRNAARNRELLERLKSLINMENPVNRQVVMRYEALLDFFQQKPDAETALRRFKEILGCTIPYEALFRKKEVYLTNEEIFCVQNLTRYLGWGHPEMERCVELLCGIYARFDERGELSSHVIIYETVMAAMASHLGNCGDYDRSDEISHRILREILYGRRIDLANSCIYNLLWNDEQRQKAGNAKGVDLIQELELCVTISSFSRDYRLRDFYQGKLIQKQND